MYAALWRHLPGGAVVKALCCAVLAAVVVVLLFTVVFPWVEPRLPFSDVTVEDSSSTVGPGPAAAIGPMDGPGGGVG